MSKNIEANLYNLNYDNYLKILPKLLENIIYSKYKVIILVNDAKEMQSLDSYLWTYSQLSFLPHLTQDDKLVEEAPIYITYDSKKMLSTYDFIVIIKKDYIPEIPLFEKYIIFYDELSKNEVKKQVEELTKLNIVCTFIKQNSQGKWEKSNNIL